MDKEKNKCLPHLYKKKKKIPVDYKHGHQNKASKLLDENIGKYFHNFGIEGDYLKYTS